MSYFVILWILFLIYICKKMNRRTINIALVQNVIWLIAFVLYAIDFFAYFSLSIEVCVLVLLYLTFFTFSYLSRYNRFEFCEENLEQLSTSVDNKLVIKKILFSSFSSWALSIPLLIKSVPVLIRFGMEKMRWILYGTDPFFNGLEMCIISYIIRPIALVSIIYFAEQVSVKKIKLSVFIVVVINSFLLIFLTAGRALLAQLVSYVAIALFVFYGKHIIILLKDYRKYVIISVIIISIILIVSTQRISRENGPIKELMIYMFSSFPYLDSLIKNGYATPQYSICMFSLSMFTSPVFLLLRTLGIGINNPFDYSIITSNSLQIGQNASMNAIASTLLPFYLDLGYLGPALYGIIIGLLMVKQEKRLSSTYDRYSYGMYLFFLNGVIFSIQNYPLSGTSTFATLIFMYILLK